MSYQKGKDLSYYPQEIEYDPVYKRHIDPATGQQTYPSWMRRARRDLLGPADLNLREAEAAKDERLLHHQLIEQLRQDGYAEDAWIKTTHMQAAIRSVRPQLNKTQAREALYRLFQCGLVRLQASIHNQSGRPMHQTWQVTI